MSKKTPAGVEPITLSMDCLIDTLPTNGVWTLEKVKTSDPDKRYCMTWQETIKGKTYGMKQHGCTAKQALASVVSKIRGLITDREAYELTD